ncbi:MAG: hypothetical protein QG580_116 [Patescibacteria group bacterium]|jgi:hypothetical protein|nr:hypothetical protein [Patescibacteria group bacterium]
MRTIETQVPNWQGVPAVGMGKLIFNDVTYIYCVLDTRLLMKLATICKDGILAVSMDYPGEYRELALIHELIEFSSWQEKDRKRVCSCQSALQQELSMAQNRGIDMGEYIKLRLEFFEGVVSYYEGRTGSGEATEEEWEIFEHVAQSRDHLKSLVQ